MTGRTNGRSAHPSTYRRIGPVRASRRGGSDSGKGRNSRAGQHEAGVVVTRLGYTSGRNQLWLAGYVSDGVDICPPWRCTVSDGSRVRDVSSTDTGTVVQADTAIDPKAQQASPRCLLRYRTGRVLRAAVLCCCSTSYTACLLPRLASLGASKLK